MSAAEEDSRLLSSELEAADEAYELLRRLGSADPAESEAARAEVDRFLERRDREKKAKVVLTGTLFRRHTCARRQN